MKRIGIELGNSFDIDKVDPAIKAGLETAPEDALALMAWKVRTLASVVNGWQGAQIALMSHATHDDQGVAVAPPGFANVPPYGVPFGTFRMLDVAL